MAAIVVTGLAQRVLGWLVAPSTRSGTRRAPLQYNKLEMNMK
jgi:hypothetical protein